MMLSLNLPGKPERLLTKDMQKGIIILLSNWITPLISTMNTYGMVSSHAVKAIWNYYTNVDSLRLITYFRSNKVKNEIVG